MTLSRLASAWVCVLGLATAQQVGASGSSSAETVAELLAAAKAELSAAYDAKLEAVVAAITTEYEDKLLALAGAVEGPAARRRRRHLAAVANIDQFSGLSIKREFAGVELGVDSDVRLLRTGPDQLSVLAHLNVTGGLNVSDDLRVQDRNVLGELDAVVAQLEDTVVLLDETTELLDETTANLNALLSCSYENDINARCGNASNTFKMANCCDGGGWELVYELEIPDTLNADTESQVTYAVDNSADFDDGSFLRIGYHLQLDDEWVFVSMNAWTEDPTALQLPVDIVGDYSDVGHLNIVSNAASLTSLTGTTHLTGQIEFWSNCYGSAGGSHGADSTATGADCYGSFQVHTEEGDTVFAYNGWSHSTNNDLGIGSYTGSVHTDWTFANNAASYDVKTLRVFVLPKPA